MRKIFLFRCLALFMATTLPQPPATAAPPSEAVAVKPPETLTLAITVAPTWEAWQPTAIFAVRTTIEPTMAFQVAPPAKTDASVTNAVTGRYETARLRPVPASPAPRLDSVKARYRTKSVTEIKPPPKGIQGSPLRTWTL